MLRKKLCFYLCCILCLFFIGGCTFQTKHRGYVFPLNLEQKIEGIKTTSALVEEIGVPQVKTVYGDDVWIYFGADENLRGPLASTYSNKTVLLVWVKGNRILKKKILHDDDLPEVKIAQGETKIPAAIELNAIEELFNNIGRFSPAGLQQ